MSTRGDDAALSDAEREAFARLQAQLSLGDRSLGRVRSISWGPGVRVGRRVAAVVAGSAFAGPVLIVLGVAAVAVGLAVGVAVGVVGLVLIALGAVPVVDRVRARVDKARIERLGPAGRTDLPG